NPGVGLIGSCRAYQQVQAGGGAAVLVTGGLYLQLAQMRPQYVNRTSQPVSDQVLPTLAARAVGGNMPVPGQCIGHQADHEGLMAAVHQSALIVAVSGVVPAQMPPLGAI